MKIKIWGCRGSIASPGKSTIKYGGNTSCIQVTLSDNTIIIIDAGSGIRNLGNELIQDPSVKDIYLFFSHGHWDHVNGFPFFKPAYSDKYNIHIRGGVKAKELLRGYIEEQMKAPFFPVAIDNLRANFDFTSGQPTEQNICNATIIPIPLNHPNGGYGFKIIENDKIFVFFPDNELKGKDFGNGETHESYREVIRGADLLIHDAQYTPDEFKEKIGWGHSSIAETINLGMSSNVKRLGLFHHDPERTDEQLDKIGDFASEIIQRHNSETDCFVVFEGQEILL